MLNLMPRFVTNKYNLIKNLPKLVQAPLIVNRSRESTSTVNFSHAIMKDKPDIKKEFNPENIFSNIKNTLLKQKEGRLFAVVQLCGKQFKITSGDIIIVQGYWPPTISDKIRLDKVLLAAANDFTLVGRPLLEPGVCDIQATVIEKTLSHTKTNFRKKRRKQYQRINFYRLQHTMIRINSININPNINEISNEPQLF